MNGNNKDLKSTIISCIAVVICAAIILGTFSVSVNKFIDSNSAVVRLAGDKNSLSANTGSPDSYQSDYTDSYDSEESVDSETSENDVVIDNSITNTQGDTDSSAPGNTDNSVDNNTPDTIDEIVAYFNTSINKVKPNALKVVKNYEKRIFQEDKTDIPDAIESTAESMVASLMGDDTEPTEYATREDITTNFIVPEQSYSSRLKSEWVESATCKDNGEEYVINIKLKEQKNPTAGNGVGAVCDVIETHEVANKVSFVEDFSTLYYDCQITATINKKTGNTVHITYTTPLLLNMTVNLFGNFTGVVAFTFVKDYTITY